MSWRVVLSVFGMVVKSGRLLVVSSTDVSIGSMATAVIAAESSWWRCVARRMCCRSRAPEPMMLTVYGRRCVQFRLLVEGVGGIEQRDRDGLLRLIGW